MKTTPISNRVWRLTTVILAILLVTVGILVVSAPYTSPSLYLGATNASYDYKIEADGLGWYRVLNGENGAEAYSGADADIIINQVLAIGGHIYFASGDYYTDDDLDVTVDYTYIEGAVNTRILCSSQNYGFLITADNVVIKNLQVNGTGVLGVNGFGICFDTGCNNGLVTQCKVTNTGLDGIHLRYCYNCTVTENIIEGSGDDSIACLWGQRNIVSNNHIDQLGSTVANAVRGIVLGEETDSEVSGNVVTNTRGVGILVDGGAATGTGFNLIVGNTVTNAGTYDSITYGRSGIAVSNGFGVTVLGNTIRDCWINGIHFYNQSYSTMQGNVIKDCGKTGLIWGAGIVLEYYSIYNTISVNNVFDMGAGTMEYGFVETGGGTNDYNILTSSTFTGAITMNISPMDGANSKINLCYNGTSWIS